MMGKHCATVAADACIYRAPDDTRICEMVRNNGTNCAHTHDAWKPCFGCFGLRADNMGKHEKANFTIQTRF